MYCAERKSILIFISGVLFSFQVFFLFYTHQYFMKQGVYITERIYASNQEHTTKGAYFTERIHTTAYYYYRLHKSIASQEVRTSQQIIYKQHLTTPSDSNQLDDELWTFNNKHAKTREDVSHELTCEKWIYDPVNWTLRFLNDTEITNDTCSFPYNEVIKKVIKSDHSIVWKGCTNTTKRCKEKAHYDVTKQIRINTPPCCRHNIMEILKHTSELLRENNITHVMAYGGVIGWYRNIDIVPYDNDLDLIIHVKFWESSRLRHVLRILETRFGYVIRRENNSKKKIYFSNNNNLNIDLWAFTVIRDFQSQQRTIVSEPIKKLIYVDEKESAIQNYDTILPAKLVTFGGFPVFIPNKPIQYLDRQYGKNKWKTPLKCTESDEDGKCIE